RPLISFGRNHTSMSYLLLGSKKTEISALLELICADLQLSDTQYRSATTAYYAISKWLCALESPLHDFDPDIYAQGSMAIGTSVRPRDGEEFDVDLVCELTRFAGNRPNRQQILLLIASRLRTHGTYGPMIKVRDRCVRVEYAGEFHADIVPALPAPLSCPFGAPAIVIPCRKEERWVPTNPRGYKEWFYSRCVAPTLMEKRAAIEPFPRAVAAENKASLQRVVQMFKRRRDVHFEDDGAFGPKSILLTTICGLFTGGEELLYDAIMGILNRIRPICEQVAGSCPPTVPNPSNPEENLARHWREDRRHYEHFLEYVDDFRAKMKLLEFAEGLPALAEMLKELFDPSDRGIVTRAISEYTDRIQRSRLNGELKMSTKAAALTTATAGSHSIPANTFFGNK
ncbi:MAG: nucleotidyltransferase domain-containing protein, partial [Tepidisphaeraceae bacterium]